MRAADRRTNRGRSRRTKRSGFSLLGILIGLSTLALFMSGMLFALHAEITRGQDSVKDSFAESRINDLFSRMERELVRSRVVIPNTYLTQALTATAQRARVGSTVGFPNEGTLLLGPGQARQERIRYDFDAGDPTEFAGLERSSRCAVPSMHPRGTLVLWANTARLVANQGTPAAHEYDGISQEPFGPRFYRGDGTGIAFQTTVPPADANLTDGRAAQEDGKAGAPATKAELALLRFVPVATLTEANRGFDFNRDGDYEDSFDLGSIHLRSRDPNAPKRTTDIALCPPMVLQETCNPAADMDGDGFEDPMFLFDETTGRLRVRLFVLAGAIQDIPVIRRIETRIYVRNPS